MKGFIPNSWLNKAQPKTTSLQRSKRSKINILIVDDSRTQIHATKKILEDYGFSTLVAENGKAGILSARKNKPNLIIMDIVMPEINGFQATRYLTRHPETTDIPIIIVSSSDQAADKAWGLKLGARDFLSKPAGAGEIITKVIRQLQQNQMLTIDDIQHPKQA